MIIIIYRLTFDSKISFYATSRFPKSPLKLIETVGPGLSSSCRCNEERCVVKWNWEFKTFLYCSRERRSERKGYRAYICSRIHVMLVCWINIPNNKNVECVLKRFLASSQAAEWWQSCIVYSQPWQRINKESINLTAQWIWKWNSHLAFKHRKRVNWLLIRENPLNFLLHREMREAPLDSDDVRKKLGSCCPLACVACIIDKNYYWMFDQLSNTFDRAGEIWQSRV